MIQLGALNRFSPDGRSAALLVRYFWPIATALLIVRLLLANACNLVPDEAFYWTWTRHLSTGYFDHPPMIAWLIWLSTRVMGSTELGVRLPAAVLSIASLAVLYRVAVQLLPDARAVGFVILMWIGGPLLPVIGTIITPDAPATFFSVCALACAGLLAERDDRPDASVNTNWRTGAGLWLLFGLCCGLAFLSKYTTVLVPGGVGLWMLTSRRGLRHFTRPWIYLSALIALAVFSPCIWWNSQHHWASFRFQIHHGAGGGLPSYHFKNDRQKWSYHDVEDADGQIHGELNLKITGADPQIIGPEGLWNAADLTSLRVEAAFQNTAPLARLKWKSLENDQFSAEQTYTFPVIADGKYRVYDVYLAKRPAYGSGMVHWFNVWLRERLPTAPKFAGGITALRLDPVPDATREAPATSSGQAPSTSSGQAESRVKLRSISFKPVDADAEQIHGFFPRLQSLGSFVGGQAAVWTPILFVVAVFVIVVNWGKYARLSNVDRLLLWCGTIPLLFFGFASTRSHGEINWPAFAYFPLSLLVARYLAVNWKGNRVQWVKIGCMVAVGFTVGVHLLAAPKVQQWIASRGIHLTHQITNLWEGPKFAADVTARADGARVVCNRHQDAGETAFYMPGQPDVWCDSVGSRITAFDFFETGRPDYEHTDQVLFVGEHVDAFMKRRNYAVQLEITNVLVVGSGKPRGHLMTKVGRRL